MTILLDQQKAVYWGEFIKVCSSMYAPGKKNPPQPSNFPKGWKLVKNINAQAVVDFSSQIEFIGFVAQSLDDPQKFAVLLHGAAGALDLLESFKFLMTDFNLIPGRTKTEKGFTKYYESFTFIDPISGESQNLTDYLLEIPEKASFTVAGYSLGAAMATLHAVVLAYRNIPVEAFLFASPMVGNADFVNTYNALVPNSYRIVNKADIIPQLPGNLLGFAHVGTLFEVNSLNSPQMKRSINCFHSLEVYLCCLGAAINLDSC